MNETREGKMTELWFEALPFGAVAQVSIDSIAVSPFNPEARTKADTLKNLLNSIREHGVIEPVKLSRDGILGDGHRRVACARIIGLKVIPAIRYNLTVEELFELNGYSRPVTNREWLETYVKGNRKLPKHKAKRIEYLRQVIGDDGMSRLAELQIAGDFMLTIALHIARYCDNDDIAFVRKTIWWLVYNKQQKNAAGAMRDCIAPEVLTAAIEGGYALRKQWLTPEDMVLTVAGGA